MNVRIGENMNYEQYFITYYQCQNINMNEMNDDVIIKFEIIRLSKENYFDILPYITMYSDYKS